MAKAKEHEGEELRPMNMRVPDSFHHRFKVWCANNRREMTEVTIAVVSEMMAGKIPVPAPKTRTKKSK